MRRSRFVIEDEVPDQVIIKISNILEPFLDDITPIKVLDMINKRNATEELETKLNEVKWITTKQAADILNCTQQTIYNMIKQDRLTFRRLSDGPRAQVRILQSDLYKK